MPQRAFAQEVIQLVTSGTTDEEVLSFIQKNYRLVLLTPQETMALNRLNRSRITPDRLTDAGIVIFHAPAPSFHEGAEYSATTSLRDHRAAIQSD
jgi:hypothetical protein